MEDRDRERHSYIAGFFDGEGWISIATYKPRLRKRKKGFYQPPPKIIVGIGNNDPSVLVEIHKEFGGYFHRRKGGIYTLEFFGADLKSFLTVISPYLKIKKPLAELALIFFTTQRRLGSSNYFLTEEERQKRDRIVVEIKKFRETKRETLKKEVI